MKFGKRILREIRKEAKKNPTLVGCATFIEEHNARTDLGRGAKKLGTNLSMTTYRGASEAR